MIQSIMKTDRIMRLFLLFLILFAPIAYTQTYKGPSWNWEARETFIFLGSNAPPRVGL